jgi:hypothetical protein
MLSDIMVGLFSVSLIVLPFVAYFAVKNDWKITKYF